MELTLKTKCFFFKFQNFEICDLSSYQIIITASSGDRRQETGKPGTSRQWRLKFTNLVLSQR